MVANELCAYGPVRMREEFGVYLHEVDTLSSPARHYRYFRRDYTPADREMCLQELLGAGKVDAAALRGTPRIHQPALGDRRRSHSNISSTRRHRMEEDKHNFLRLLADCNIPLIEDISLGDVEHIGRSGRYAGTVSTTPGPDKIVAEYLRTYDLGFLEKLNNLESQPSTSRVQLLHSAKFGAARKAQPTGYEAIIWAAAALVCGKLKRAFRVEGDIVIFQGCATVHIRPSPLQHGLSLTVDKLFHSYIIGVAMFWGSWILNLTITYFFGRFLFCSLISNLYIGTLHKSRFW